jgi:hypothetical protein
VTTKPAKKKLSRILQSALTSLSEEDALIFTEITKQLVEALTEFGDYLPIVDDLHIEQIAISTIQIRKLLTFANTSTATLDTHSRVNDSLAKLSKNRDNAINQLLLSRRDRLNNQTQTNIKTEFEEKLRRICANAEPTS